jgi:hypothetical protein
VITNSISRNKILIWVTIGILSLIQILFAVHRYPLVGSDGIAFLPAAINFANGNGLTNNLYSITRALNGQGAEAHFINYPPLFPLAFGCLLKYTHNIYLNFAFLHIVLMLVFFLFSEKQLKITKTTSKTIILILFIIAWNTQLNSGIGRPEAMAELGLLCLIVVYFTFPARIKYLFAGLLVLLTGFIHPVAGIYAGLILFIFMSIHGFKLLDAIALGIGSFVGLLFVIIIYPFDFYELMNGIVRHAEMIRSRSEFTATKFLHYHFTYPEISFYFFIFLLFVVYLLKSYRSIYNGAKYRITFIVSTLLLLLAITYFTFQTIETSYNLYVLFPLMAIFIMSKLNFSSPRYVYILSSILIISSSSGFIRRVALFPVHIDQGLSFEQARGELKNLKLNDGKVFVSTSLFMMFDSMTTLTDDINDSTVNYILLQQNYSGKKFPPQINNFRQIYSSFIDRPVFFSNFKISNSVPGYQFAVYAR